MKTINLKTYVLMRNNTRFISLSEARKLIPVVKCRDIIEYKNLLTGEQQEMIVTKDERIACLKRTTKLPYYIQRIDVEK